MLHEIDSSFRGEASSTAAASSQGMSAVTRANTYVAYNCSSYYLDVVYIVETTTRPEVNFLLLELLAFGRDCSDLAWLPFILTFCIGGVYVFLMDSYP